MIIYPVILKTLNHELSEIVAKLNSVGQYHQEIYVKLRIRNGALTENIPALRIDYQWVTISQKTNYSKSEGFDERQITHINWIFLPKNLSSVSFDSDNPIKNVLR